MRPVSAQFQINQAFASMRTAGVVGDIHASTDTVEYWVGRYGNYQPDGHAGCDFACPIGTPVYAMAPGTVLWADWGTKLPGDDSWGPTGYFRRWALYKGFPGIVTVIQHPGWIGVYAHLSDAPLNPGDKVTEGQRIATSGNTGGVDPHLHVEALVDLNYPTGNGLIYGRTNPEPYFGAQGIAAQAGTITPLSQEDDMAFTAEQEAFILKALGDLVDNVATKKDLPTPQENKFVQAALVSLVNNVATKKDLSGVSAAVVSAAKSGASADEIRAAVNAAMAAGLKVDVTVNGGN